MQASALSCLIDGNADLHNTLEYHFAQLPITPELIATICQVVRQHATPFGRYIALRNLASEIEELARIHKALGHHDQISHLERLHIVVLRRWEWLMSIFTKHLD